MRFESLIASWSVAPNCDIFQINFRRINYLFKAIIFRTILFSSPRFVFTGLWHLGRYKSACLFKLQPNTLVFVLSQNTTTRMWLQVFKKLWGLPLTARTSEGNRMPRRESRFIWEEGRWRLASSNRDPVLAGSSQLPSLWLLEPQTASRLGKPPVSRWVSPK